MLIDELKQFEPIQEHIADECAENGCKADIDKSIGKDAFIIIKPDSYYNSMSGIRPPSPDCLIIIRCGENEYNIYIVELKDISNSGGFSITNIREKFNTCLNDFMQGILSDFFINSNYIIRDVKLFFVTDPYDELSGSRIRLSKTTKMDALLAMNTKPFRFGEKRLGIEHRAENPVITR